MIHRSVYESQEAREIYSGSIIEMEMSLLDTFTMVSLRIRQPKKSFLEEVTETHQPNCCVQCSQGHTLSRSKRQKLHFEDHVYRIRQRYHPHPTGKPSSGHHRV